MLMINFRPTVPQGLGQFMAMLRFGFGIQGSGGAATPRSDFLIRWRRRGRR
jgi:hypothetical protein